MKIDMHIHTTYSDGELTPMQILNLCYDKNMKIISITDHNSILGVKEAIKINPYKDIRIVTGIELSSKYRGGEQHILGYNFSLDNKELNEICKLIVEDSLRRIKSLVANLHLVYGISFKDEELQDIYNMVGNIGRPEIAKLCVKHGYVNKVQEAFDKFFIPIKDKTVKKQVDLTAKECIEYITKAGGIVSLAHPITLNKDINELKNHIKELKEYGLSAIEVYHSKHTQEYSGELLKIANDLELLCSAGTDYHGTLVKPNIFIGEYNIKKLKEEEVTILTKI